jgi:5'-3' exonuclease
MATIEEAIKDAKIAELLDDVIAIEKEVKAIPERINSELIHLTETLKSLPGEIDSSIKLIASATEEAEKSAESLANATINNIQTQINEIVKESVDSAIKQSLASASKQASDIEQKIKLLSGNIKDKQASMMNIILGSSLAFLIIIFGVCTYKLYETGMEHKKNAEFWFSKSQQTESGKN